MSKEASACRGKDGIRKDLCVSDPTDRTWSLQAYVAVSHSLKLISDATRKQCDLAKEYRDLIHPAKEQREKMRCTRATALGACAAVQHVVEDLESRAGSGGCS